MRCIMWRSSVNINNLSSGCCWGQGTGRTGRVKRPLFSAVSPFRLRACPLSSSFSASHTWSETRTVVSLGCLVSSVWCLVSSVVRGNSQYQQIFQVAQHIYSVHYNNNTLLWLLEVYNRSCFKKYKLYVVTLICVLLVTLINDFCSGAKLLRQIYLVLLSLAWCRAVHCSSLDGNKKVII